MALVLFIAPQMSLERFKCPSYTAYLLFFFFQLSNHYLDVFFFVPWQVLHVIGLWIGTAFIFYVFATPVLSDCFVFLHFLHWLSQRNGLANSECQFSMAQSRTATRCRRQLRLQYYNSLVRLVNLTSCHLEVQVGFRKLDTVGWHNKANVILRT